jgi:rod shape-determining protein MreB
VSQSLRVGGDEMDEAIINHIKREYKLLIGQQTAGGDQARDRVRRTTCARSCRPRCAGRDMLTGLPKTVVLSSEEVRRALDEPVQQIVEAIKSTLDKTPPSSRGHHGSRHRLAGGGALLSNFDERLRHETQMPVHLAESPLTCVASGRAAASRSSRRSTAAPRRAGATNHRP